MNHLFLFNNHNPHIRNGFIALLSLVLIAISCIIFAPHTSAASLADWKAGNIIEDAVFTNSGTMDATSIQTFLNSKVPTCDTYGTKTSEFGGGTRAQWAAAKGYSPPFTCLKDFKENGKTSAQIIYDAAQEFSINPQVLIVLLQKEQSLVTDTWPIPGSTQYRGATGYGCPDTAACNSKYYGLTNQVRWSARMYRAIMSASPSWYTPYVVGSNYIRYSPDSSCGGSTVIIENRATQALYNYTPYQPNAAALASGWGSAYCGAYGNRNFYQYFVDWFGSTRAVNGAVVLSSNLTTDKPISSIVQNETITASYTIRNKSSSTIQAGGFGICGRINGNWYDFGFIDRNSLAANAQKTISFSKKLSTTGALELFTCSYSDALGGWASDSYPYNDTGTVRKISGTVKSNPLLTSSVNLSESTTHAGTNLEASFTIKNSSSKAVNMGRMVLAVRDANQNNYDFPSDTDVTIPAGGTYNFSKSRSFKDAGKYTYFLSNRSTGGIWDSKLPSPASSSIKREGSFTITANPVLTTGVSFSPAQPQAGEPVTVSISVKNNSPSEAAYAGRPVIFVRSANGSNFDFPSADINIPAGETFTYTQTRTFTTQGNYTYGILNNYQGKWVENYPIKSNSTLNTSGSLKIGSPIGITLFSLSSSNLTATTKQLNALITIRNTSSSPVNVGRIVVAVRNSQGVGYDLPSSTETIVPANSSVDINTSRILPLKTTYSLEITAKTSDGWSHTSPAMLNGMLRNRTVNF